MKIQKKKLSRLVLRKLEKTCRQKKGNNVLYLVEKTCFVSGPETDKWNCLMKTKSVYFLYIYLLDVWYLKKNNSKKTRSTRLKSRYNNQSQPEVTVDKMEPVKHS